MLPDVCLCRVGFELTDAMCMFRCMNGHTVDEVECSSAMEVSENMKRLLDTTTETVSTKIATLEPASTTGRLPEGISSSESYESTSQQDQQEQTDSSDDIGLTGQISPSAEPAMVQPDDVGQHIVPHLALAHITPDHWLVAVIAALAALAIIAILVLTVFYTRRIDYDVGKSEKKLGVHYNAANSILAYA